MREPDFGSLPDRLLRCGIAPRDVYRTVNELRDHYDDLVDAAIDDGATRAEAHDQATERLGRLDDFVDGMRSQKELKSWAFRYPRIAVIFYPLACLAALPALPLIAGIAHASAVARWGTSLILAGLFTATMLLIMQLSIVLG